jgi:hypothetical protein
MGLSGRQLLLIRIVQPILHILFAILKSLRRSGGYPVLFIRPFAEVDQLASLRTERTIWTFSLDWLSAVWTLHMLARTPCKNGERAKGKSFYSELFPFTPATIRSNSIKPLKAFPDALSISFDR